MKKICLALVSALLVSCGSSSAANTAGTTATPTAAVSEDKEPEQTAPAGSLIPDLLLGEWELVPKGETASNMTTGIRISFDEEGLRVTDTIRNSSSFSEVTYGDIYNMGNGQVTKLTITPKEAKGSDYDEKDITAFPVDFSIFMSSVYSQTYIALRELGNGMSYYGTSQFRIDYQDDNYFWIFRKLGDEAPVLKQAELPKGKEFYAFCWYRNADSLCLQEVNTVEKNEEWYGLERPTLSLVIDREPKAASVCPVTEEVQWRIFPKGMKEWAGSVVPYLMRVTTDSEGNITKFYEMRYLGYGMYEASQGSMFDYAALLPTDSPENVFVFPPGGILTHDDDLVYVDISNGAPVTGILFTKTELQNFRILEIALEGVNEAGEPVFAGKELYQQDRFYPEHPIALTMTFYGDSPNVGISYEEPYGGRKYYALYASGMDGSLLLDEIKNVKE